MQYILQLYISEPAYLRDLNWFKLTKANYVLSNRKLYIVNKNEPILNKHFPLDFLENTNFNAYYITIFCCDRNGDIEDEFDIGFSNIDKDVEIKFLQDYLFNESPLVYGIINTTCYSKNNLTLIPYFNYSSPEFIGKNYNLINEYKYDANELIFRINNDDKFNTIMDRIELYIVGPSQNIYLQDIVMKNLNILVGAIENSDYVISKTNIHGQYNYIIYSKNDISCMLINKMRNFTEDNNILFEYFQGI